MVVKGDHPKMAELFRLVKYSGLYPDISTINHRTIELINELGVLWGTTSWDLTW